MASGMRWSGAGLVLAALVVRGAAAQPVPFKANVKTHNAADGTTATGVMYFDGTKVRTELTMDGRNMVILADPAAPSQYLLMPSEKMYMALPRGRGTGQGTGPTDPANPCSTSGNTDCVKGPTETISGYETVRWDYTSQEGTKTTAWVSTKLRFPLKTTDAKGSSTEFSDIAEGAQPATLFAIPAGYTKMDMGGRGRGG
jgi:hypothetical protein